jgi:hypothetical protein
LHTSSLMYGENFPFTFRIPISRAGSMTLRITPSSVGENPRLIGCLGLRRQSTHPPTC